MTCVKTYWPAYIGAPAIQTSRRGRKTSEKIQVDNARKRHFTEKYQLVMLSSRNNVGTPVGIKSKFADGPAKTPTDDAFVAHLFCRPTRFSSTIIVKITANAKTSMPAERICAGTHCKVST